MTRYLTIQEVAQLARCEHRTVRRAIRSGELNASLIGGRWIVREDAVEAWFEARANHRILSVSRVGVAPTRRSRPQPSAKSGPPRPGSVADLEAIRERILEP
jgi:excisionase family DNA binding protein